MHSKMSVMSNFSLMTLIQIVTLCGISLLAFRMGYWPLLVTSTISASFATAKLCPTGGSGSIYWSCAIGAAGGVVGAATAMLVDNCVRERPAAFLTNFEYQSIFVRSVEIATLNLVSIAIVGAIVAIAVKLRQQSCDKLDRLTNAGSTSPPKERRTSVAKQVQPTNQLN